MFLKEARGQEAYIALEPVSWKKGTTAISVYCPLCTFHVYLMTDSLDLVLLFDTPGLMASCLDGSERRGETAVYML